MTGKVMRWYKTHRDYYIYSATIKRWVKVGCTLPIYGRCTSPTSYPRGTKFDGSFYRKGAAAHQMLARFEGAVEAVSWLNKGR